jgi:hypothetical protein
VKTAPRKLFLLAPLLVLALAVLSACGGDDDDDDDGTRGQLSDPNNVPTATAWLQPPEVLIIDPNNLPTLPPSGPGPGEESPTATPAAGEPGECGQTYTVEAGDTTFGIAEKCGVSVEAIEAANPDIDIRALTIGDVLIMPPPEETAPEEATPDSEAAQ